MDPAAQKIHGLSDDDLRESPPLLWAIEQLEGLANPGDVALCGHNVSFDVAFLRGAYKRLERQYPYDYHTMDVSSVAAFAFAADGFRPQDYTLDTIASLYNIHRNRRHDALQDVHITAAILRYLYRAAVESGITFYRQPTLFPKEDSP